MGTDRVLTAPAGSPPRPNGLVALLETRDGEKTADLEAFAPREPQASDNAIATRLAARVGLSYDGGQGRNGGSRDVNAWLTGFGGAFTSRRGPADPMDCSGWSIPGEGTS